MQLPALHYRGVVFIMNMTPFPVQLNNFYLFDSRRTCFVQHLHLRIQSFIRTLLFCFSLFFVLLQVHEDVGAAGR